MTRRAVIAVLDGLRRDLIGRNSTPRLAAARQDFEWFCDHRSVFPSTTRVSAACIATGCRPARHGLLGNTVALRRNGALTVFDAGKPGFFDEMRQIKGRTLGVPTLAQRVAGKGGAIVFSNVSPGAAYVHDPDGYGHVYHPAGSYGPGRTPIGGGAGLSITHDAEGDWAMTERFCEEVLQERRPTLALIWLGEPDHTQHTVPLGSDAHMAALEAADRCAGQVIEACNRISERDGDDILLIIGSDHGHQTIRREIDIEAELAAAGFDGEIAASEVVVASNGTAALIYLDGAAAACRGEIAAFLREQDWAGEIYQGGELSLVGLDEADGLAIAVAMRHSRETNEFGVPGLSDVSVTAEDAGARVGRGQHGGLGHYEQAPFLMIRGTGFAAAADRSVPSSLTDVAPTVLQHLGMPFAGTDGRPLQSDFPQISERGQNHARGAL